jgi:hypothetical protein
VTKKIPKIKNWFLSPHAAQRMAERNFTVAELEIILDEPDFVLHQGPKLIFSKNVMSRKDNMLAAVVLEKRKDLWLVITIMVNFQKK